MVSEERESSAALMAVEESDLDTENNGHRLDLSASALVATNDVPTSPPAVDGRRDDKS